MLAIISHWGNAKLSHKEIPAQTTEHLDLTLGAFCQYFSSRPFQFSRANVSRSH